MARLTEAQWRRIWRAQDAWYERAVRDEAADYDWPDQQKNIEKLVARELARARRKKRGGK